MTFVGTVIMTKLLTSGLDGSPALPLLLEGPGLPSLSLVIVSGQLAPLAHRAHVGTGFPWAAQHQAWPDDPPRASVSISLAFWWAPRKEGG